MRLSIQYGPIAMLAYNSLLWLEFSTNNRCTSRLCYKNGPFVSSGLIGSRMVRAYRAAPRPTTPFTRVGMQKIGWFGPAYKLRRLTQINATFDPDVIG